MGEEESDNTVSRADSNGSITPEKTLDDMGDKKVLESEGGKTLEDNEVKDLKGDDIKEMEVDKKADNEVKDLKDDDIKEMEVDKKADGEEELEVEEDKKADDSDVIIDDNKVGDAEEIKEDEKVEGERLEEDKKVNEAEEIKDDKKVNEREDFKEDKKVVEGEELKEDKKADEEEKLKEDKKLDAGEEIKDGKKDVSLKESEDDKKDDIGFEDDKLGEETDVRETMDSKEEKESVEAKKPALDVMEEEDVPEDKVESGEKDKGQEKVEDAPEDKGGSGKKEKGLEKEENDKVKVSDKSTEEDIIVEKVSKKRGRGKGNVEKGKKKIKEQKGTEGIPEDKDESSEKVESQEVEEDDNDKVDYKSNEDDSEDMKVEKGLKRRRRRNIHEEQVKETEARTPASASTTNRPVRERKSVERLVESYERDISKEFFIDEGSGTHLKDIPNVAFKLSSRKVDDTLKFLHTILFCRRGKAAEVKKNISRFSGFVWYENEEKQMIKVKEKFDKCNKEKLLDICDVLDIQVAKANTRKEDIIAKLINFLVAPHVTRAVLLGEQEKSVKGKKRKHVTKHGSLRSGTSTSRRSAKSRKKNEDSSDEEERKTTTDTESDSEKEDEKGVSDRSEDERPQKSDSEDKNDSESDNESEDVKKMSKINKTFSREKEFAAKGKAKETTFQKKPRTPRKRTSMKSLSTLSESDDDISERGPKVFSRKKRNEKQKTSTLTKSSSKDNTEKVTKRKGKNKEKSSPSDDQLRIAICDIFKQVDFNTATFTDILKLLGKQFDKDLTPRKASLKIMIQEELSKQADEDEEGDTENDETHTTDKEVEA